MPGQGSPIASAIRAASGTQAKITGTGVAAGFDSATLFSAVGALAPGTYQWQMPTQGAKQVDVRVQGTHTTVNPTGRIYQTFLDGTSVKGTAVALPAFPGDGTDWVASITTPNGEIYTVLEITVPATATFTPTIGEYSAL